jgi:hypothetical protein
MPIHDWTRVPAGGYHTFHQDWTIEIYRALNRGLLPAGYGAYTDLRVEGWEPDIIAIQSGEATSAGGLAVAESPPQVRQVVRRAARVESEEAVYARKANRIIVRHEFGQVVAIIEIVSPGNKSSAHAARSFVAKGVEFLRAGVSLVVVDPFPPTPRDPDGLARRIWDELTGEPLAPGPDDQPLTVASFDALDGPTAYVDPVALGDPWPDAPLFLAPGRYINLPLERTYQTAWEDLPQPIRDLLTQPS